MIGKYTLMPAVPKISKNFHTPQSLLQSYLITLVFQSLNRENLVPKSRKSSDLKT